MCFRVGREEGACEASPIRYVFQEKLRKGCEASPIRYVFQEKLRKGCEASPIRYVFQGTPEEGYALRHKKERESLQIAILSSLLAYLPKKDHQCFHK